MSAGCDGGVRSALVPRLGGLAWLLAGLNCSDGSSNAPFIDAGVPPGATADGGGFPGDAGVGGQPDGGAPIVCTTSGWARPVGSSFSDAYRDVVCHRWTCGPCTFEGDATPPFVDKEACFERLAMSNTAVYANLVNEYDDPELFTVDASDLARCLDRLQTCAHPSVLEEACPEIDTGRLPEGACCDRRGGCRPGLACVGRTEARTGVCRPRKGGGELCTGTAFVTGDCQVGLRCVRGRCAALVSRDGECSRTFECAEYLVCAGGRCTDGRSAGQSCGTAPCAHGLFCNDGVCRPWNGEGQTCDSSAVFGASDGGCQLGLYCRDDNTCRRLPARGASCEDARACRHPRQDFCNISSDGTAGSGLCQARHPPGADCLPRFPRMCSEGSLCVNNTCVEELAEPLCP